MLKRKERLNREAFNRFFSSGRRFHSPHMTLVFSPKTQFHASIVVSKKVATTAVRRNKLRRQAYDIIRRLHVVKSIAGVCIVVMKPAARLMSYKELKADITALIEKTRASR